MKHKTYNTDGKLQCDSCGNDHYRWWMLSHKPKYSQKIGCASYMMYHLDDNSYTIASQYGSGYDTLTFKVVYKPLANSSHVINRLISKVQSGREPVICDKCIARFIKKRYIINTD